MNLWSFRPSTTQHIVQFVFVLSALSLLAHCQSQSFQTKQESDRVDFFQADKLVTSYRFRSGSKPILWPLIGPDGARMSREFPMVPDSQNEEHDHLHHRSLWMTFGEVNDTDFWAEGNGKGEVVHTKLVDVSQSAKSAWVEAEHLWCLKPKESDIAIDSPLIHERCKFTVSGTENERMIDCEYVLQHADSKSVTPIHFGDTKEGMFAIRVPEAMRADKSGGRILNSSGELNGDTWGQPADWVDYSGKASIDAKDNTGISILIHPSSFGRTGYWHVRTYGLFAHNPIGAKHFLEGKSREKATTKEGGFALEPGKTMHLYYRVILHRGQWTQLETQERFKKFEAQKPSLN